VSDVISLELLVFEVSGHHFAVPLSVVEEVVPCSSVTRIPNSPPFLLGLSAVRGKIMVVIDAARRYGLSIGLSDHFLVCLVRGNITAISIDRPLLAGLLHIRQLDSAELELQRSTSGVDAKFIRTGYEILELIDESGGTQPTGIRCVCVDPDLFVSAEMASRIGEAA
jgi:chemotaxis signal transduction protein